MNIIKQHKLIKFLSSFSSLLQLNKNSITIGREGKLGITYGKREADNIGCNTHLNENHVWVALWYDLGEASLIQPMSTARDTHTYSTSKMSYSDTTTQENEGNKYNYYLLHHISIIVGKIPSLWYILIDWRVPVVCLSICLSVCLSV